MAVRIKATTWIPSAIYAGTSSVILAPMLWELTLRFKVFPPSATAAIIALFVLIASAIGVEAQSHPRLLVTNATAQWWLWHWQSLPAISFPLSPHCCSWS